jgi:TPP-dependent indolepyruvate ferredoxin oxidoreductase alpha subunit
MKIAQALAATARSAGVGLVTHVPGFGASQTFACWEGSPFPSYHEEVALGLALGSALTGHPSLCLIKMHGLLKAANALVCGLSAGVAAACVVVIFDDPSGAHSDNQLPTRSLLAAFEIGVDIVDDPQQAPQTLLNCLHRSQQQRLPRILLVDSEAVEQPFDGPVPVAPLPTVAWSPDPVGQLVCPLFGSYQRARLIDRLGAGVGVDSPPLPHMAALPARWQPTLQAYRPWLERALAGGRAAFVAGDTGLSSLFGLKPYEAVDAIGWMGGSIPLALGALAGGHPSAWSITGDFSFVAAGYLGWIEARRRSLPLRVLLFDNGCAQATGGQPVESETLRTLLQGEDIREVLSPDHLHLDSSTPGPLLYWLRVKG